MAAISNRLFCSNVKKGMPAFEEETFGPMAAVIVARDETGSHPAGK